MSSTFLEGERVRFDGWDTYPPNGAIGTVTEVRGLREPDHPFAYPFAVRWDAGGYGHYSASMLLPNGDAARPLMLDLFCKAGGAGKGYHDAGFDVVGVDIEPQPNYPYRFIQADALDVLRDLPEGMFVAAHASPPCQLDCAYRRRGEGVGDGYHDLIAATRELLEESGLPYVIENVTGARHKLHDPVQFCGSSFGLDVQRHRLFESNVPLTAPPCDHSWWTPRFPAATNRKPNSRLTVEIGVWRIPLPVQQAAMGGVDWMTRKELSNAIPPAYTEHIGKQLMAAVLAPESAAA